MNISIARNKCGITQSDLASRLGITQGAVSQWENGTTNPSIELLPRIAEILGCTVDELLRKESSSGEKGGEI